MLLIAQPKSASTSLLYTLCNILRLKPKEGIPRLLHEIDCEGFPQIQTHHCNMIERSSLFIKQVIYDKKIIFREHLLPTKRHLLILKKINKNIVILLRKPKDSFDSYMRTGRKITFNEKEQLLKDLNDFNSIYKYFAKNNKKILVITFEQLIFHYWHTMKKIIEHFGFKISRKIIPLEKKKYTGIGERRIRNGIK